MIMTMARTTATLYATMYFTWDGEYSWQDGGECDVTLTYTSNGHDYRITKYDGHGSVPDCWGGELKAAADDFIADICDVAYAEWLDGRDEYLCDQAEDRRAIDSCGGAPDAGHPEWSRGYNEALEAAEREVKRLFARATTTGAA